MLIVGQTTTLGHVIPRYYDVGSTQGLWARSTLRTSPRIYLLARGSEHDILEKQFHGVFCVARSQRNPPSARIPQPIDSKMKRCVCDADNREGCVQSKMSQA